MARFSVDVVEVIIEPHPNADALDLARVGDYMSIVKKGQFATGDLAAYIPEQSIVPQWLLAEMGLLGRLAGKNKDRVKAIRLRGVLSQGLMYAARPQWQVGDDVAAELGIEKYRPQLPTHMAGKHWSAGLERCMRYDIDAHRRFPDVIEEGEQVVFTEKIHGTWTQFGVMSADLTDPEHGALVVASKGVAAKGLAFKIDEEARQKNLYVRAARSLEVEGRIRRVFAEALGLGPVFVLGELFGRGVQDLHYGAEGRTEQVPGFRVFDIHVGRPGNGRFLEDAELDEACEVLGLPRVPVLYRGPFSAQAMDTHADGKETISGAGRHIREGIIMRTVPERRDDSLGRVQLKRVSAAYLLRNGGTEYE
ncbi:MAG: RNA ligase (ATP) [Bradymonadia bacterium]